MNNIEIDMLKFLKIFDECSELRYKKLKEYGIESYKSFDTLTPTIRIYDKINRIKNLLKSESEFNGESIRDNFIDICNYAIMGVLILDENLEKLGEKTCYLPLSELKIINYKGEQNVDYFK